MNYFFTGSTRKGAGSLGRRGRNTTRHAFPLAVIQSRYDHANPLELNRLTIIIHLLICRPEHGDSSRKSDVASCLGYGQFELLPTILREMGQ